MTRRDFPAAHSMDTTWFAVDRDGRVALFSTGEAGAVPLGAGENDEMYAFLSARPAKGYARVVAPPRFAGASEHQARPGSSSIFYLKRADAVAAELASGVAVRIPSEGCEAVAFRSPSEELFARLHSTGECLACGWFYLPEAEGDEDPEANAGARGLYRYGHSSHCENWISGPYELEAKPERPLREAELPEALRSRLVRFGGSFEETPLLQPVKHWECESWQSSWLDLDGRTVRPIPGHEDEYAEEAADFAGDGDLVFDPPPRQREERARVEAAPAAPAAPAAAPRQKPWWKVW